MTSDEKLRIATVLAARIEQPLLADGASTEIAVAAEAAGNWTAAEAAIARIADAVRAEQAALRLVAVDDSPTERRREWLDRVASFLHASVNDDDRQKLWPRFVRRLAETVAPQVAQVSAQAIVRQNRRDSVLAAVARSAVAQSEDNLAAEIIGRLSGPAVRADACIEIGHDLPRNTRSRVRDWGARAILAAGQVTERRLRCLILIRVTELMVKRGEPAAARESLGAAMRVAGRVASGAAQVEVWSRCARSACRLRDQETAKAAFGRARLAALATRDRATRIHLIERVAGIADREGIAVGPVSYTGRWRLTWVGFKAGLRECWQGWQVFQQRRRATARPRLARREMAVGGVWTQTDAAGGFQRDCGASLLDAVTTAAEAGDAEGALSASQAISVPLWRDIALERAVALLCAKTDRA